jgi:hypothetical protein
MPANAQNFFTLINDVANLNILPTDKIFDTFLPKVISDESSENQ